MKRSVRHNPMPPPIDPGPERQLAVSAPLLERIEQSRNWKRGVWALGAVVTEAYREAARRGEVADDRVEELLRAVQQWCLGEINGSTVAELQKELYPHGGRPSMEGVQPRTIYNRLEFAAYDLAEIARHSDASEWSYKSLGIVNRLYLIWKLFGETIGSSRARVIGHLREAMGTP